MGIFSSIKSAIWGSDDDAVETKSTAPAPAPAAEAAPAEPERAAISEVDVVARVSNIPGADKLNWRTSIVDLMKLLNLDRAMVTARILQARLALMAIRVRLKTTSRSTRR